MMASEKSYQNLSNYKQFLLKKGFEVNEKQIFSCEEMKIQVICIEEDF